jgi:hypothetical protein
LDEVQVVELAVSHVESYEGIKQGAAETNNAKEVILLPT